MIETSTHSVAPKSPAEGTGRSVFVTAQDGLRLHVREYGSAIAAAVPVVCLPGLTRTIADFDALAPKLAYGQPRAA